MTKKQNFLRSTSLFFFSCALGNSALAAPYVNNDLSAPISDGTIYDSVTVTNNRTLTNGSGYVSFDSQTGNVTFTNDGSISTSGNSHNVLYIPNYGNTTSSTQSTFTLNNNGTLATTGDFSGALYIPSSANKKYDLEINNSGTMNVDGAFSSTIYSLRSSGVASGSRGNTTIVNSGTISKTTSEDDYFPIDIIRNDATTITNSGIISAGDASKTAISIVNGNSATINILNGSDIIGKISSSATTNNLNIKKSISITDFNTLNEQLVGTWTSNIADGGTISGVGTVNGNITIASGGHLAAGNSIGTMNVVGNLTLNSGSNTDVEYDNIAMDKTIVSGDIAVAGAANFSVYNYNNPNGKFVVSQNILESTSGTVLGKFDSKTIDNNKFLVSTSYSSNAVRATISRKLDASTLDAPLMVQNSIGRMIGNSISTQLQNNKNLKVDKTSTWISSSAFNSNRGELNNSSPFSTNGYMLSAGLVKSFEDFQISGGVFNSYATANRFDYFGKDQIDTNGFAFGLGQANGDFYNSVQIGAGFYTSDNRRNVAVNNGAESARSNGRGNFQYINLGTAYTIPAPKDEGKFIISLSAGLQNTQNKGFHETGLSYGNFSAGKSSAKTFNLEAGLSYKNEFNKMLRLPQKSFFEVGVSGYQSEIFNKKSAMISQEDASYKIQSQYRQGLVFGASALARIPISESTSVSLKLERRQNGSLRNNIGSLELNYKF